MLGNLNGISIINSGACADIEEPCCMCNILWSSFEPLILMQVIDINMWPDCASFDGSSYCLFSCTPGNDRQSLSKVTTKQNSDSTKGMQDLSEVSQSVVYCISSMFTLHRYFIPYDDVSLFKKLVQV